MSKNLPAIMKKIIRLTIALFLLHCSLPIDIHAQTTINNTSTAADLSSILDLSSTTHGFLVPRMTATDRLMIGSPAKGLFLFQTNEDAGFQYNRGTDMMPNWNALSPTPDTVFCDNRIPMDSVGNGQPPFRITEPGSYYFTRDITFGWGSDGIDAVNADESTFKNLHLIDNGRDGLATNFNGLIINCVARNNGLDGLDGDNGTIIVDCVTRENGGDGIQVSEGCIVLRCHSYDNKSDGFEVGQGNRIEDCMAYRNEIHGFDVARSSQVIHCKAYDNGANGFDMASNCFLLNSSAMENGYCINGPDCERSPSFLTVAGLSSYGNGARVQSNGRVKGAGTAVDKQNYKLLHPNPAVGINYYRLKQVDFDGSFEYSDMVAV